MKTESGWLIESENGLYIGEMNYRTYPTIGWTSKHMDALRFARKEDAERMIRILPALEIALHEKAKGATEHQWDVGPRKTDH